MFDHFVGLALKGLNYVFCKAVILIIYEDAVTWSSYNKSSSENVLKIVWMAAVHQLNSLKTNPIKWSDTPKIRRLLPKNFLSVSIL